MLFKKPSIFVFKKKLNVVNSKQLKYVKNFKIKTFNNMSKINFTLNQLDIQSSLFNQTLKQRSSLFRKILFKKWNVKKHFKMKLFSRMLLKPVYNNKKLNNSTASIDFSFIWSTQRTINSIPSFLNTHNFFKSSSNCLPITVLSLPINRQSNYVWTSILTNLYDINNLNPLTTTHFKQLSKLFYLNHTKFYTNITQFFDSNKLDLLTFNSPSLNVQEKKISVTKIAKKKPLVKLLAILGKYLPHINLVRLFRRTKNKKTLSYKIDKSLFFKSTLIRINLDYKFYTINTFKNVTKNLRKTNSLSLLIRGLSRDNLLENKFDSTLEDLFNISNITPFTDSLIKPSLITFIVKNRPTLIPSLPASTLVLFDYLNLQTIINQPLLYKYLYWLTIPNNELTSQVNQSLESLNNHSFSTRINLFKTTNLWPSSFFHFTLKRKILKIFSFNKFLPNVTMWYYNILIRFMESCTGKKVFLKFNPFIENFLSFTDLARCNMWSIRINSFQKLLGPKIFLNESLRIMHIALRFKDPTFFANWIKGMLNRMSFWKYRLLFRYIKFAMRYLFWLYFSELQFKGLKIKLKGKISVAGNARTRTLIYRIGETGYSKIDNRVICDSSTINTFAGVLGFKIWFFF